MLAQGAAPSIIHHSKVRISALDRGSLGGAGGLAVWATRLLAESIAWDRHGAALGGLAETYSPST